MSKSEMFKKAHQMTREDKAQFPKVNYRVQFGLNLAFLHEVKEEIKVVELKGTEKQVKWATGIREKMVEIAKRNNLKNVLELINSKEEAKYFIDNFKSMTGNYKSEYDKFVVLQTLEVKISLGK